MAYEMRISDWSSDVCSSDRPVYFGGGAPVLSAVATGSAAALTGVTATTYSLPVWYASAVNAAPVSITIREPPALGRDSTLRTGVAKSLTSSRLRNESGRLEIGRAHV